MGEGELGQSWVWEQRSKCKTMSKWSVNSDSAAALGSALGQSVTSTEVSKQNKLVLAPTDTQATLVVQVSWVSLAWSVIMSLSTARRSKPTPGSNASG